MKLHLETELVSAYPGFKLAYSIIREVQNDIHSHEVAKLTQTLPDYVKANKKELLSRAENMKQFYKKIGSKNKYHILSLLKSTLNGREYKLSNPAVDLVYAVELQNGVLMGLHDLNTLHEHIYVGLAQGNETLEHIFRGAVNLSHGAIIFRNYETIMASLSDGPDNDTKVTKTSKNILVIAFGDPEDTEVSLLAAMQQTNNLFKEYDLGKPEDIFIETA